MHGTQRDRTTVEIYRFTTDRSNGRERQLKQLGSVINKDGGCGEAKQRMEAGCDS